MLYSNTFMEILWRIQSGHGLRFSWRIMVIMVNFHGKSNQQTISILIYHKISMKRITLDTIYMIST